MAPAAPRGDTRLMSHSPGADGAHTAGPIGWIREIVLDCQDPWHRRILGGAAGRDAGAVVFRLGHAGAAPARPAAFVPGHRQARGRLPPGRDATGPAAHFDVLVSDLAGAHERVVRSGGVFVGEHVSPRPGPGGGPVPWRVYCDPAGHPFCLVVR